MNKNWTDPKIIIGSVATGDYFFNRNEIIEQIWAELKKGNSVLLAAPRRVGKTSVMQYLEEQPTENYKLIFQNIQGIKSANEFYERIYTLLLTCLNKTDKAKKWFRNFLKSKSITEITLEGIKFKTKPADFLKETNSLLKEINENQDIENIVLLLDELPEVLFNINKTNNEDAISILKNLQHWRKQPEINKNIKFVLAGSVGIHYVVEKIETRTTSISDLATIPFNPLPNSEAYKYIDWATQNATITYRTELKQHLLNKIQYLVPYFINLMLDKINRRAKETNNPEVTAKDIDTAFDSIARSSDDFRDWKNRLEDYMSKEDFNFVNEILIHTAHRGRITLQEIYDKAVKYDKTADYMDFIRDLEKDGYITEVVEEYRFVSPFLSAFWKKNNPIYNA